MSKKCKCALEILKNIVENRASFTSKQVIVSYPREILSQPLWKRYSYVREFLSFPTMWQRNVSFRNFLCLFPYFWNWIKTSQVRWLFCQLEKFPLLGNLRCWAYLHLQYLIFWWQYHFRGIIFRSEFSLFPKMVLSKNSPFSVSPWSLTRKMVPRKSGLKFLVFSVTPYQNENRNCSMA